ncbi:hypothetical protein [Methylobacterium sp. CM6244]
MSSTASPSAPEQAASSSRRDEDEATLPGIISDEYNTVFERIMARTIGENGVAPVVACVAYSLYKTEKRDWIVQRRQLLGRRARPDEIEHYVSGVTELRIESLFTQARELINSFASDVLESSKTEINDEIYRRQFGAIHDQLSSSVRVSETMHESLKEHITSKTKPAWGTGLGQNLVANFIWTAIVVIVLISLNLGFDFNNFSNRIKAFFNPPAEATQSNTGVK